MDNLAKDVATITLPEGYFKFKKALILEQAVKDLAASKVPKEAQRCRTLRKTI